MATFADGGRITLDAVEDEIRRLRHDWQQTHADHNIVAVDALQDKPIDLFDQLQLANVLQICHSSQTAAEAGRKLFNVSRMNKASGNDSHRLIQFLAKFGLDFKMLK